MVRDQFPPAWLSEQYSVLRQRGAAACQRVWRAAAHAGHRGLRTIKDASKQAFERLRSAPWRTMMRRYKVPLLVLGGVLLAAVLLVIIIEVPQRQAASWRGQPGVELKDLPKLENDARTTLIQGLGGLILLSGLGFTLWNLRLTQDKQITEHYTRAVEQLGSDKLEVRLGAIYALERIARHSERDHWPIMEILTAYMRERAPWKEADQRSKEDISSSEKQPTQDHQPRPKLATDIQAILTVLGRRAQTYKNGEDQHLDLQGTDLRGVRFFYGAHLEGALFWGAHLEGAIFNHAHLDEASLPEAHLEAAVLPRVHLNGASLRRAHLRATMLSGAHLQGATFTDAHLEGAWLNEAHLEGAKDLTIEQLCTVTTLFRAQLDPPLAAQVRQRCPKLLEPLPGMQQSKIS